MFQGGAFWFLLASVVVIYWIFPRRWRGFFLTVTSFIYLLSLEPRGPVIALLLAGGIYWLTPRGKDSPESSMRAFALCLITLAMLGYFKYSPQLPHSFEHSSAGRFLLPLGISYFTFKIVHYVIESWRGSLPQHRFRDFVGYILLFPTFTVGPIERFDHYISQRDMDWDHSRFVDGLWRIVHGLVKRFALVDVILPVIWGPLPSVNSMLDGLSQAHPLAIWWYLFRSYVYAYLEFSAYTDMAIGSSLLFGIRIMENFRFPLVATTIADYWQRWHMTLAGWCQSYVYMPLLGATRNPYIATYMAFTAIGIWHAATLQWLVWGLYHATGIAVHVAWRRYKIRRRWTFLAGWWWIVLSWTATQLFVSAAYSFSCTFPHHTFHDSIRIFVKLFGGNLP